MKALRTYLYPRDLKYILKHSCVGILNKQGSTFALSIRQLLFMRHTTDII